MKKIEIKNLIRRILKEQMGRPATSAIRKPIKPSVSPVRGGGKPNVSTVGSGKQHADLGDRGPKIHKEWKCTCRRAGGGSHFGNTFIGGSFHEVGDCNAACCSSGATICG